jgi:hypothetical protein
MVDSPFSTEEQQVLAKMKRGSWYVAPKLKVKREILDGLVTKGILTAKYNGVGRDVKAEYSVKFKKRRTL